MKASRVQRYATSARGGLHFVAEEGDQLCVVAAPDEVRNVIYMRAHRRAFELAHLKGWILLRGALVDINRRRVLLVGGPGAWLTLVALRLALNGAAFQGADSVLLRDGLVIAVPRPLMLEGDAERQVPELAAIVPRLPQSDGVAVLDPARDLAMVWQLRTAPVDHVVVLEPEPGALVVEPTGAAEILAELARALSPTSERPPPPIAALSAMLTAAQGHRLRGGDLDATEDAIRRLAC